MTDAARAFAASADVRPDPGLGLYVHWPFCLSKCPYCDFNSHVRESVDQARWRRALVTELDHYAALAGDRHLTSIFFGGGTPSLMVAETVAAIIEQAAQHWRFAADIEITLEANPGTVDVVRFAEIRDAGVNRLSLGVQSFDDDALAFLGRRHDAASARAAVALARDLFPRFSFDLIYARPNQTPQDWRSELGEALGEGTDHLSLYQLTIEDGTAFHAAARRGELTTPDETASAELFDVTQQVMTDAGLPAYEISNHARPGEESRHNLSYWRYADYLGIGPGAHGRLTLKGTKRATRQHRAPEAWLAAVEEHGHATRRFDEIAPDERLIELVVMGLRLRKGIARSAFLQEAGDEPEALLDAARLQSLQDSGDLVLGETALRATDQGLRRLNSVIAYLLA